jgi:hypothetical protein
LRAEHYIDRSRRLVVKRISLVAVTAVLCACSSGGANTHAATTEAPDLRSSSQLTQIQTPGGGGMITIDWEHQHTYEETKLLVGPDKAWSQFPTVFGELGIPTGLVDQQQHVFGNYGVKVRGSLGRQRLSKYLECGSTAGMSNADTYDVVIRVVSQVVPADAGLASLRTQVEGSAHSSGDTGPSVRCVSTGALEARIAHKMSELAAKPAG